MSGCTFGCHNLGQGFLLASGEMYIEKPPITKAYAAQIANSDSFEKSRCKMLMRPFQTQQGG